VRGVTFLKAEILLGNLIASKYPFIDSSSKVYTGEPAGDQRNFVHAKIRLPTNEIVSIYGTHLNVTDESERRRVSEVEELLKIVEADATPNKVIAGDFNAVRPTDYQYAIAGKKVWDLLVADDRSRGIATPTVALQLLERAGFKDSFAMTRALGPLFTVWSGKIVDFIWLSRGWYLPVYGSYVYYSAASDHCPVITDITVTQQKVALQPEPQRKN
jgi:endonuclease/exonuclease/phosphatase family metal-dependent hydrolase